MFGGETPQLYAVEVLHEEVGRTAAGGSNVLIFRFFAVFAFHPALRFNFKTFPICEQVPGVHFPALLVPAALFS